MDAVFVPVEVGVKVTVNWIFAPTGMVVELGCVITNIAASVPVIVITGEEVNESQQLRARF